MSLTVCLPELDRVACARCGATLELTALAGVARCAHCAHQQPVPVEVQARLSAYCQAVRDQLPRVVAALDDADLFTFRHAAETKFMGVIAAFATLTLVLWCAVPVAFVLTDDPAIKDKLAFLCFGFPLLVVPLVPLVRWLTRDSTRKKRCYRVQLQDVACRCSSCGGDNTVPAGKGTATCRYCGSQMVASPGQIAAVVADVRGSCRAASLRKHAVLRHTNGPRANVPLAYRGNEQWYRKTVAAIYARPQWDRYRQLLCGAAQALGGAYLEGDQLVAWLDESFAGYHPSTSVPWSHPCAGVALVVQGHPVLVELFVGSAPATPPRLGVAFATDPPDDKVGDHASAHEIARLGFELVQTEGGLYAGSRPDVAEQLLRTDPTPVARDVIDLLTRLAQARRLAPPTPPRPLPEPS